MAITLKDVASVAGVSTATVSRALAGSERVAPQTASHIRTVAEDLGYRFDNVARALRQKRSNLVGLVLPDFAFPYGQELLFALNQELYQSEFVLAAVSSFGSFENEYVQVERLLGQRIDALLIVPADPVQSTETFDLALAEDIPVIQLFGRVQHAQTSDFQLDYAAGLEFALRSLKGPAIRSIAYLNDPQAFLEQSKFNACQQAIARLAPESFSIVTPGARQYASFESALEQMASDPPPDLIICSNNRTLRMAAKQRELSPSAESTTVIVCLDPVDSAAAYVGFSVVAVEYPMQALAREVIEAVNRALNGDAAQPRTLRLQAFLNLSNL